MGCPRPKYFFSSLPNLLPQKIRLPLISFFSGVNYIWGSSKNFPGIAHTNKHSLESFYGVSYIWGSYIWGSSKNFPSIVQIDTTVALIYKIRKFVMILVQYHSYHNLESASTLRKWIINFFQKINSFFFQFWNYYYY